MQTTLQIGGKSVRLDLYEPRSEGPRPAILLLHGAGGNTGYWLDGLAPLLARAGIAAYAVHYFDRTGTIRADPRTLSDGVHVPLWLDTIRETLVELSRRPTVDAKRIALVGVSLGAFLSLAVATDPGTPRIRAIVDVSGGLVPPYEAAATAAFPPTLILHGDADTVVSVSHAHALDVRLNALKVEHPVHIFPGEGHWFSDGAQMRILAYASGFLARHLASEHAGSS